MDFRYEQFVVVIELFCCVSLCFIHLFLISFLVCFAFCLITCYLFVAVVNCFFFLCSCFVFAVVGFDFVCILPLIFRVNFLCLIIVLFTS